MKEVIVGYIDTSGNTKTLPGPQIMEGGVTELVGVDEQVDQNDYGASVGVALPGTHSGEILSLLFHATEDGSGAVLQATGQLLIFDADPSISAGATSISTAVRATLIGAVAVGAGDWVTADANGATAYLRLAVPFPFHSVSTLYFAWFHTHASSFNDAAGDDEQLEFNFWYRRRS